MPSSTSRHDSPDRARASGTLALWTGALAGPIAWLALLQTNYTLSYLACETRQTWFLHLATVIAVLVTAAAGLWAWRSEGGPYQEPSPQSSSPLGTATRTARARWMAWFSVIASVFFIVVMIAMSVPVMVLRTCQ